MPRRTRRLIMNGLRSRVRIEADGKLMSGRDVAIACHAGCRGIRLCHRARWSAMGCVMMRVCNLDTCPMGICHPESRAAQAVQGQARVHRELHALSWPRSCARYMAKLGVRTVDELVGRTDLLKVKPDLGRLPRRA